MSRVTEALNEYLRINAIRRMLAVADVKYSEIAGLTFLAADAGVLTNHRTGRYVRSA